MGAKEDLIAKMQAAAIAKTTEEERLVEQNHRFSAQLPRLYDTLEIALEGIPELTTSRKASNLDHEHASFLISFLGETIEFKPKNKDKTWGVQSTNLAMFDMFFLPDADGVWSAKLLAEKDIINLTGDLIIERLSALVDKVASGSTSPWD